ERLVMAILISPGTPTLRMSANSSQRGVTPRKLSLKGERPERRYQIKPKLPIPNGRINPHAAPAGPSAGSGPAPKIRRGDNPICASTQATRTAAGATAWCAPHQAAAPAWRGLRSLGRLSVRVTIGRLLHCGRSQGAPRPRRGLEQLLDDASWESRAAALEPDAD